MKSVALHQTVDTATVDRFHAKLDEAAPSSRSRMACGRELHAPHAPLGYDAGVDVAAVPTVSWIGDADVGVIDRIDSERVAAGQSLAVGAPRLGRRATVEGRI